MVTEPIAASADGARNAFYLRCQIVGQNRPYAGCIARCNGGTNLDADCTSAIKGMNCPAQGMRKDEELQGRALYFIERVKTPGATSSAWVEGKKPATGGVVTAKPTAKVGEPVGLFSMPLDFSHAVAVAVAEHAAQSPVTVTVTPPAKPAPQESQPSQPRAAVTKLQLLPGESPLDALRRTRNPA